MDLAIYGAQGIALGAYNAIKEISPEKKVLCFVVTKMGDNVPSLGGIPVWELAEFAERLRPEEKDSIEILIGTPEPFMPDIEKSLTAEGFYHCKRLDSVKWAKLQEQAFSKNRKFIPVATCPLGEQLPKINVYMAKCRKDKALDATDSLPHYLIPIEAGAAQSNRKVADIFDNNGDNISSKNNNYSELTALYWIWKNKILKDIDKENHYYGLAHYRRFLMLSEDDLTRVKANGIDAVLPYPMPYEPNIEAHPRRYLTEREWAGVLAALEELVPEYAKAFRDVLQQEYLYNYNIIVARGKVLADYCEWLFGLLFRIEELNDPDGTKVPNRYLGYVGEILETLYFMYNQHGLKIAHTGCKFLL